jgi:hypothetical protein
MTAINRVSSCLALSAFFSFAIQMGSNLGEKLCLTSSLSPVICFSYVQPVWCMR